MIGADFPCYELVNGAIYSVRDKHLRISVWIKKNKEEDLLKIGKRIREVTGIPKTYGLGYQVHKKAIKHDLDNQRFLEA